MARVSLLHHSDQLRMYPFPLAAEILSEPSQIERGDLIVPRSPASASRSTNRHRTYPWSPGTLVFFAPTRRRKHWAVTSDHSVKWESRPPDAAARHSATTISWFTSSSSLAGLQPGGQKFTAIGPPHQRRAVVVPHHVHLRRRLHRGLWLRGVAAGHLDRVPASALLAIMGLFASGCRLLRSWPNQQAFAIVFGFVPRMIFASLMAFWCGEFANSFVMAKMKLLTSGRYLWTSTVGSTVVGQAVDTVVVMLIAFGGSLSMELIANLIVSGYLGKVAYEAAATPMTYAVVNFLKRAEHADVFDQSTNFSPFALSEAVADSSLPASSGTAAER